MSPPSFIESAFSSRREYESAMALPQPAREAAFAAASQLTSPGSVADAKGLSSVTDAELTQSLMAGRVPPHALEKELGDCQRAVRLRRAWLEGNMGVATDSLPHGAQFDAESFY